MKRLFSSTVLRRIASVEALSPQIRRYSSIDNDLVARRQNAIKDITNVLNPMFYHRCDICSKFRGTKIMNVFDYMQIT